MPPIERRYFLLFAASTLAMLGLNQLDILQKSQHYARVLSQNTPRKLALLVGINAYPFGNQLAGCLTDIELQQHLLVHRFGFNPKDILILTDETLTKPTRQNILTAFEEHLIKQAQPGDVVVFHYSGHGSQVIDPEHVYKNREGKYLNSTFVPIDNTLSLKDRQNGGTVPDITGHTLFLLMSALKTENLTVTLDCCHSGGGKRGNLTVRALDGNQLQASELEREYQQQWLKRLNLSAEDYRARLQAGIAKGIVIAAAGIDQFAADMPFSGFKAGAFTYIMTQYLWQQTGNEASESAITNIGRSTTQVASGQNPEYEAQPNSKNNQQPIYFLNQQIPPGEAVITGVEGNEVQLWLGGVNSDSIRAFDQGAILTVVDAQGKPQGLVQLQSPRQGLSARAKPIKDTKPDVLKTGTVLQERVRVIPTNVSLRIGLDPSLANDTAKVEPPMRGIKQLETLPVQQGQEVEYILGRITQDNRQFQKSRGEELPSVGSIGLFTPALELIPGSFGTAGESVEAAVTRLKAKFKSLLATHLVKMILNPGSSQLKVVASMSLPDSRNQIAASTFPVRGKVGQTEGMDNPPPTLANDSKKLPIGTRLQFNVTNQENRDLYVSILVIDPQGEMTVIFPNTWTTTDEATVVKAGETLRIPVRGQDRFKLTVQKPVGMVEILVIASATSLRESLNALQAIAQRGQQPRGLPMTLTEDDPKIVVNSLLSDLNRGTRGGIGVGLDENFRSIDSKQLAAMSITFESIDKSSN